MISELAVKQIMVRGIPRLCVGKDIIYDVNELW